MPDVSSGWGRLTWGQANWNEATTLKQGWGAKSWGEDEWGQLSDAVAQPTGLSITSSVGSITNAISVTVTPTGVSFNSTLGTISNVIGVTVEPNGFTINDIQGYALPVIDAPVSITGLSITAAIGVIDPKDQVVGLPTLTVTSQQGTAFAPNEYISVTGQSITSTFNPATAINAVEILAPTLTVTSGGGGLGLHENFLEIDFLVVSYREQ